MMVYIETFTQPSIFELARSGNFQALSYWIDSLLRPEGISARVEATQAGCIQILIEFQRELAADALLLNMLRERLVRFICHHLWRLNCPAVEGVRVIACLAGTPDILWKQSVRIVTPATRQRRRHRHTLTFDWVKFKSYRSLLLVGSALASFVLGCWVSYHEALALRPMGPIAQSSNPIAISAPPPKRPDTLQAALEIVPVVQHQQVQNPSDPTVTLMFGGDVALSDSIKSIADNNYRWAFAQMDEYRQADLAMVNLETSMTRSTLRHSQPMSPLKADPEAVKALVEGGVDIVSLANNQMMDYEEPGLVETIETLDKAGIHHVGAGRDLKEARRPQVIEVKGQRIAYLAYYDADFQAAGEGKAGINPRRNEQIAEDIRAIRSQVDWVVVNYHWGAELADYPGDWQIDLARFTIDQGADLVVGHHSQALQGAEIYKGRPVVYSLGNFIFGGNGRSNYNTAVLKVSLKERKMRVEFLPVEVRQYQPQVVKGESAKRILKHIEQLSSIFDQPMHSPVVLEAPPTRQKQAASGPGTVLAPQLPSSSPAPSSKSNAASPLLPNLPKDPDRLSTQEETTPTAESSPPPDKNLPPRLYLNPPQHPPKESDPFIKEPFIKDPFISPPSPNSGSPATPHSFLSPNLSPSFKLDKGQAQTITVAQVAPPSDRRKELELPPLAARG